MKFITLDAVLSWSEWKEYRAVAEGDCVDWAPSAGESAARASSPVRELKGTGGQPVNYLALDLGRDAADYTPPRVGVTSQGLPEKIVFVSHRWITNEHPDPHGVQLREVQRRLTVLREEDKTLDAALLFYDYCSMPQQPRTTQEEFDFRRDINALRDVAQFADKFIILSESYADYKERAWCFFELVIGNNVHVFDDQEEIRHDLAFRSNLMLEPTDSIGVKLFITSEKMSYKPNFGEAEVIASAFQHLSSCRATHSQDVPLIRLELARHFNAKEMTSFGRLLTAIAKFFDVAVTVCSAGEKSSGPIVCRPYFENREWVRLPVSGTRDLSKFAVPAESRKELLRYGYTPLLRLTMPGVTDFAEFLRQYQKKSDWERYVVGAAQAGFQSGSSVDCFPTIRHAVHTLLELPTHLMVGPSCLYMWITDPFVIFRPLESDTS